MTESILSNLEQETYQYILDVLSSNKKSNDICLDNFAKAYIECKKILNNPAGGFPNNMFEQIEGYLETASKSSNEGLGEIISKAISQLKSLVTALKESLTK